MTSRQEKVKGNSVSPPQSLLSTSKAELSLEEKSHWNSPVPGNSQRILLDNSELQDNLDYPRNSTEDFQRPQIRSNQDVAQILLGHNHK